MKTTLLLALFATLAAASAQPHPLRDRIRRHFDADKDGKLNDAERAAAIAAVKDRGAEAVEKHLANPGPRLLEKFDADKDGKLSDAEKNTARETIKARLAELRDRLRAKVDANGDGTVDDAERAKAREAWQRRQAK